MRCSAVANSVASPPAEPDIRSPAGYVLATQRHITGADEEPPPCTVSGMVGWLARRLAALPPSLGEVVL
jgi:hypothetical protein